MLAFVGIIVVLPVDPREDILGVGILQLSAGAARAGEGVGLQHKAVGRKLVTVFLGGGVVRGVLHETLDRLVGPAFRRIVGHDRDGCQVLCAGDAEEREIHVHVVVEIRPVVSLRIGAGGSDVVLVGRTVDADQLRIVFGFDALLFIILGGLPVGDLPDVRGGVLEVRLAPLVIVLAAGRDVERHGIVGEAERIQAAVELVKLPLEGGDGVGDGHEIGGGGAVDPQKSIVIEGDIEAALFQGLPCRIVDRPRIVAARRFVREFLNRRGIRNAARVGQQGRVARVHVGAGSVQLGGGAPPLPETEFADGPLKAIAAEVDKRFLDQQPPQINRLDDGTDSIKDAQRQFAVGGGVYGNERVLRQFKRHFRCGAEVIVEIVVDRFDLNILLDVRPRHKKRILGTIDQIRDGLQENIRRAGQIVVFDTGANRAGAVILGREGNATNRKLPVFRIKPLDRRRLVLAIIRHITDHPHDRAGGGVRCADAAFERPGPVYGRNRRIGEVEKRFSAEGGHMVFAGGLGSAAGRREFATIQFITPPMPPRVAHSP